MGHDEAARRELAQVEGTDFLHGTPTVTVDEPVDLRNPDWLDRIARRAAAENRQAEAVRLPNR